MTPYRIQGKSGKNDANGAAALCEASSRSHIRFVPVKTISQHGVLSVHLFRQALIQERTAYKNQIRAILSEFEIVFVNKVASLDSRMRETIVDTANDIAGVAEMVLDRASQLRDEREYQLMWCDQRIAAHIKDDEQAKQATQ